MFRCEICKQVVPPNTPCKRVVTQTRQKTYYFSRKEVRKDSRKQYTNETSKGTEIVKEVNACPKCAKEYAENRDDKYIGDLQNHPERSKRIVDGKIS